MKFRFTTSEYNTNTSKLGTSHSFLDDIQLKLKLPKLIYDIIKEEEEYQIDIYFSNILEPQTDYTYPNEY